MGSYKRTCLVKVSSYVERAQINSTLGQIISLWQV